jgi:hypothetical protein
MFETNGAIQGVFLREPVEMLFKFFACLQRWGKRLRAADQERLERLVASVRAWSNDFMKHGRAAREEDLEFF